jgi:hypothetical protein
MPILLQRIRVDHFPAGQPIPSSTIEKAKAQFTEETCTKLVRLARGAKDEWLRTGHPLPMSGHAEMAKLPPLKRPFNDTFSDEPHKRQRLGRSASPLPHITNEGDTIADKNANFASSSPSRPMSLDSESRSRPPANLMDGTTVSHLTPSLVALSGTASSLAPGDDGDRTYADGLDQSRHEIDIKSSSHSVADMHIPIYNPANDVLNCKSSMVVDHYTAAPMSKDIVPTSPDKSEDDVKPDGALPLPSEVVDVPGIWGIASGGQYSTTHLFTFNLQEDTLRAMGGWAKRYHCYE